MGVTITQRDVVDREREGPEAGVVAGAEEDAGDVGAAGGELREVDGDVVPRVGGGDERRALGRPVMEIIAHLRRVVAEETEHATLAWDTLEWCADEPAGRAALDAAVVARPPLRFDEDAGHGPIDEALAHEAADAAWARCVPRLDALGVRHD